MARHEDEESDDESEYESESEEGSDDDSDGALFPGRGAVCMRRRLS